MVRARTAEKSARGGGSHIQTSENLFVETASAQQMKEDVELATRCKKPVHLCSRVGGMIPSPEEVLEAIKTAAKEGGLA